MAENVFCAGQKIAGQAARDGWLRTFRGHPPMNDDVKGMILQYAKKKQYWKILVFFTVKCGFDDDYSEFLVREAARGYL